MKNVLEKNMKNDLCSGCGVCCAACPVDFLVMRENEFGELRPAEAHGTACLECGMCLKVCPFEQEDTRITIEMKKETCYIGFSDKYRANGSSGGCCTWFLNRLLQDKIVDAVVCVSAQNDTENLFAYTVCRSSEELKECSGSAYYPISLGKILKKIQMESGRIAVIGVPCFVSSIQKLRRNQKKWEEKIVVVIGLVCGHLPSKRMTDCLVWANGKKRDNIENIKFRFQDDSHFAWDYGVKITFDDESIIKSYGSDDFGFLFWRRLFSQNCCNYCSDVFAIQADITFMDAWLPEYEDQKQGTSMMICREESFDAMLMELKEEGCITQVPMEKAYLAQKKVVEFKKQAGKHVDEERVQRCVKDLCQKCYESDKLLEELKRLVYKEKLKKENKVLWWLLEIKDRIKRL